VTLPNFLIIGAGRSGTSSLYYYLGQHPQIYMSPVKEPRYFGVEPRVGTAPPIQSRKRIQSRKEYERLFAGVSNETAVGEASPQYLNSPTAAARIAADLPGVRLIALLRNPADRAYSSYIGQVRAGVEFRSVEKAMQPDTYYFQSSLYAHPLERYFSRFARQQIKVVLFDDLVSDARAVVKEILGFLDVATDVELDLSIRHNVSTVPRFIALNALIWKTAHVVTKLVPLAAGRGLAMRLQRPLLRPLEPLSDPVRRRMLEAFEADIRDTGRLIGRDLSHWLQC